MGRSRFLLRFILCICAAAPLTTAAQTPEAVFTESCAMCHTIGGGDGAGPDLLPSTKWSPQELRAAVERMQENTGPLEPAVIDGLVELLRDPDVKARLEGGGAEEQKVSPLDSASAAAGRQLFFGEAELQNGGVACFACHATEGRGGTLAADLTDVYERRGETPLIAATVKPAFPLMRAEYSRKPLTEQEALNIAAFLRETSASTAVATQASAAPLFGAATLAAFALFAILGAVIGVRRTSGGRS